MKVREDDGKKYFYPDVLVSCTKGDGDSHFEESPRLIIEVLSNSTRKFDKTLKRLVSQNIASLMSSKNIQDITTTIVINLANEKSPIDIIAKATKLSELAIHQILDNTY